MYTPWSQLVKMSREELREMQNNPVKRLWRHGV